jgi:hypothetical protein
MVIALLKSHSSILCYQLSKTLAGVDAWEADAQPQLP